ncbi:MAG: sodium-dependent transporter [Proteobacteria bacterium]|nr:sodium-dependent transporter [Pseudomonadota bacterium]
MSAREQWGSRHGFLLATIGAAVGLGNIWRFSYVAGENGGAVFLFIYLACILLIGLPLVIAELSLGRRAQGDAVAAFELADNGGPWRHLGWVGVIGSVIILSYYAVIAGWALKYFTGAATGTLWTAAATGYGAYFKTFIADRGEPIGWQAAMLAAAMFTVAGGVRSGIERVNRALMPMLVAIIIALAAYAISLPNSGAGLSFLFAPDWSVLAKPTVYIAALGQAFFSLGIGMAVFVTYGSYMPRTFSLPTSAAAIAFGDSLFAIIAGIAIFPAVFSFGVDPTAGPELAFITLPQVFLSMPGGKMFGFVFFLLLSAAAFTSMVALLEVPVSVIAHRLKLRRWSASAIVGAVVFAAGVPSAMSFGVLSHIQIGRHGILDGIDAGVSNLLLPICGVLVALFVGWRLKQAVSLHEADLAGSRLGLVWLWLLRIIVPVAILAILLQSASTL